MVSSWAKWSLPRPQRRSASLHQRRLPKGQATRSQRLHWKSFVFNLLSERLLLVISGLGAGLLLWQTDGPLMVATLSGVGTIFLLSRWQRRLLTLWQDLRQQVHQWLHHPFAFTVVGGVIACLGTYTLLHIGQHTTDPWLVVALVILGILLVGIIALLATIIGQLQQQQHIQQVSQWFADLTHPQPLHRLVAIRQLARVPKGADRRQVQEALYLLLGQETDAIVRRAALEVLDHLDDAA
ncbi:hypothetical protein NBE99_06095 [Thermosynechococcus sp. HN-54]|uniref:hypothetical protein n=1 Tax=Thermosynechococcus sp. HN-54 TaxID=2933959 RepID=UPI00202CDBDC|nr:hypothetical protein [Thermosynechococcus sp. HN-54]URR36701.1 hypothetical protein NBE99_06095 [Thermosynechococcus sp. HN-54]